MSLISAGEQDVNEVFNVNWNVYMNRKTFPRQLQRNLEQEKVDPEDAAGVVDTACRRGVMGRGRLKNLEKSRAMLVRQLRHRLAHNAAVFFHM